jgi:exonuclease SbcD
VKLIHTADWHLGRLFHGLHLTRDQEHVLDQFVQLVADVRPDAVLIAGDVYDRAVPPTEAVALLDDVLERIVLSLGVPVVTVAGNHDSPDRLGFASALLRERGLLVAGPLTEHPAALTLQDEFGPVVVHALPFAEAALARAVYGDDGLHDQAAAVGCGVARARTAGPAGTRCVLVTHAFVAGGLSSESERPITVGGTGAVPAGLFTGFDYVALGHLHRPQALLAAVPEDSEIAAASAAARVDCDRPTLFTPPCDDGPPADALRRLRYAGSLLKYSFDEAAQLKSVAVVELGAPGSAPDGLASLHVEEVALAPRHDVRRVRGLLDDLIAAGQADPGREDYIEAVLDDPGALYDAMGRLRRGYPNALNIELPELQAEAAGRHTRPDPSKVTDLELFGAFFQFVGGRPATEQELAAFAAIADGLQSRQREAAP